MIVNMKTGEPFDVRIDRASKWGNPFTHLVKVANKRDDVILVRTRQEAIDRFKQHLLDRIQAGEVTLEELAELRGKRLGCWCAPQPCHGEALEAAAEAAYRKLYC